MLAGYALQAFFYNRTFRGSRAFAENVLKITELRLLAVLEAAIYVDNFEDKLVKFLVGQLIDLLGVVIINEIGYVAYNLIVEINTDGVVNSGVNSVSKSFSVFLVGFIVALVYRYNVVKTVLNLGDIYFGKLCIFVSFVALGLS